MSYIQMIQFVFCIICCSQAIIKCLNDDGDFCTIHTNSGPIRGTSNQTLFDEVLYYSFRGIPFAKPPVGDRRFKAPQKIDPWDETFDAFNFGNDCMGIHNNPNPSMSEDCLHLNVYVPMKCSSINSMTKLPVMFYVYGGAYEYGTSRTLGPDFFMETDVIIVTSNFRMGIFGWLSLNLPEYSGNMGIKDVVLALQWVNENIEQFGGDKNQITIFGHSSGAAMVGLLVISPLTKGMFQKAMMLSALSIINPIGKNDYFTAMSFIADTMYYPIYDKNDLIEFLHQIDGLELLKQMPKGLAGTGLGRVTNPVVFLPCIEDKNAIDPFLTESPFEILTSQHFHSDIDTLYSVSSHEIRYFKNPDLLRNFDEKFQIEPPLKINNLNFNSEIYSIMSERIRHFYFGMEHVDATTLENFNSLITDCFCLYGTHFYARTLGTKSCGQTFFARYSISTDLALSIRFGKVLKIPAASGHADLAAYIFRFTEHSKILKDEDYRNISKDSQNHHLITLSTNFYANFAKYSNPIPEIDPVPFHNAYTNHFNYYDLKNNGIRVEKDLFRDRMEFWDTFYNEYKNHLNTSIDFTFT